MRETDQPLRVLQVVTNMDRGGLETMLMNYYRQIDRTRVQFDFLTHRESKAAYDDEIRALGGNIYHVPRLVPWSRSYKRALDSFFAAHPEYAIVHVHQDCLSAVALQAAKKRGVPVRIGHSHTANQNRDMKYPIKLFYKRFIPRYATALMACSRKAGEWMFGGAPFSVLPNAIDAASYRFDPETRVRVRAALSLQPQTLTVGHVGRLAPEKNHTFLLDIFAELLKLRPDARLLLVGEGTLEGDIRRKAETLGIADKIVFTGVRSDVNELLQAMDVFVLPSHYEGLPVTIVEAQAAGLPCLISDNISSECILTGDLVDRLPLSGGAVVWAEKLLEKCGAPRTDRRAEIAEHGFDIVTEAKKLQEFYSNARKK